MCALDDQKSKASCGPIMTTLARDVVISMSAHSLPVISCDGCGACCAKQGTPPMLPDEYAALPKRLKWNIKKHALRYDYKVNEKLDDGYLLGNFSVSEGTFYQVVYKTPCGTTRGRR